MSLPDTSEREPSLGSEPAACEACGAAFSCGAKLAGCWCAEVTLSEDVQTELRGRYASCLCRACLEHFAELEKEKVAERHG